MGAHLNTDENGVSVMKVSLSMPEFPMLLLDMMKSDLSAYVNADIQVGGGDTVFVTFASDDVAKAQCAIIICDKYYFAKGDDDGASVLNTDER